MKAMSFALVGMKMCCARMIAVVVALLLSACGQAPDSPTPAAAVEEAEAPDWQAGYEEMVAVLSLSSAEQTHLRETMAREYEAFAAWMAGPDGQAVREEDAALRAAAEARDVQAVRRITGQAQTARAAMRARLDAVTEATLAALPPAQRQAWAAHQMVSKMLETMAPLGLSAQQEQALRTAAPQAYGAAVQRGESNPASAADLDLERYAETQLLTPDQATRYAEVKRDNLMRSLR